MTSASSGVPTPASKAKFQMQVSRMNVLSSEANVTTGQGLTGNIEFWPHNYAAVNAVGVPNASNEVWDFGDAIDQLEDGYGSMQVHDAAARQTIFALNNWKSGPGRTSASATAARKATPCATLDWTFNGNAHEYATRQLKVLVRLNQ